MGVNAQQQTSFSKMESTMLGGWLVVWSFHRHHHFLKMQESVLTSVGNSLMAHLMFLLIASSVWLCFDCWSELHCQNAQGVCLFILSQLVSVHADPGPLLNNLQAIQHGTVFQTGKCLVPFWAEWFLLEFQNHFVTREYFQCWVTRSLGYQIMFLLLAQLDHC